MDFRLAISVSCWAASAAWDEFRGIARISPPGHAKMWLCASGAAGPREGLSPLNDRFLPDTFMVIFFRPN